MATKHEELEARVTELELFRLKVEEDAETKAAALHQVAADIDSRAAVFAAGNAPMTTDVPTETLEQRVTALETLVKTLRK